jgi:hypothetical protein
MSDQEVAMRQRFLFPAVLILLGMTGIVSARESRVERDFLLQKKMLTQEWKDTGEEACRFCGMQIYCAGKELRKIEWEMGMSNRLVKRDYYFSRGKAVLAIERSYDVFDDRGDELKVPRFDYMRRVWLSDKRGSRKTRAMRQELREHVNLLKAPYP